MNGSEQRLCAFSRNQTQIANHDCSRRHSNIFFIIFSKKIRLDVTSKSSARQRIHMKNQALFSLKDKSRKLKCRLLQFLFEALRVNLILSYQDSYKGKKTTFLKKT